MKIAGFISYSHQDGKELTDCLTKYLKNLFQDFEPVYDNDVPEGNELKEIMKKLALCNILFVVITPGALSSKPVADEIEEAKKRKMKIIPCKDQYVNKGWGELPWDLSKYKGIEFENSGELKRKAYSALVKALEELSKEFEEALPEKTTATKTDEAPKTEIEKGHEFKAIQQFEINTKQNSYMTTCSFDRESNVLDLFLDRKSMSIRIIVKVPEDDVMRVLLKRDLINARNVNGEEEEFIVLIDGEEVDHKDLDLYVDTRAVGIKVPKNATEIEIIGSEIEGISFIGKPTKENKIKILPGSSVPSDEGNYLDPKVLTINTGEEVTWSVDDSAAHTVTSGDPSDATSVGAFFDSGLLLSGNTFSVAFQRKGIYKYFDVVHPWIKGEVTVK